MNKKIFFKKFIIVVLLLYIITTVLFVSVFPKIYLSHKYDTKFSDYKIAEYHPGYFAYDINYWDVVWHDSQLVYEFNKNGRKFLVEFMDFNYYDSYQMKDVSEWLTKELQYNVDKNIDMVNVGGTATYGIYNKEKDRYKNVVWTKDNVNEIIKAGKIDKVFIKTNNIGQYIDETRNKNKYTNSLFAGDMNSKFKDYMAKLGATFIKEYNNNSFNIILHQNKLPECDAYYRVYGIDLNKWGKYEGNFVKVNLEYYV